TPDYSTLEAEQRSRLAEVKRGRDASAVGNALDKVLQAAGTSAPLMSPIIDAVRARATLGEISDTLRQVWGLYRPG
ncbi:MAG TPA: methylmalonyl-CoA mutase family protein, partial [Gemmatimonadales bacterium]|nr:methylmalonyl-CoA mutase family protein [Gemmatimonadales bacterium]